jgi:DNA-binding NtrC family response regulator
MNNSPEPTSPTPLDDLPDWFLDREVIPLEDDLALVVSHATMRGIVAICRDLAANPAPLLLTGETGVGKTLIARFLHASRDPEAPLASFLCAGLDEAVLRARLFGPDQLAENAGQPTLMDEAADGTLVLEEAGLLPESIQRRLMEFWDSKNDCGPAQWICTTNAPEQAEGPAGPVGFLPEFAARFRRVHVPPLRERPGDIPALVAYFARMRASKQKSLEGLARLAERLADYSFPGNVRELESLMALEAIGLPWRWRVAGAEQGWGVKAAPRKKRRPPAAKAGGRKA